MSPPESGRIGGEFELHVEDLDIDPDDQAPLPGFGAAYEIWLDTGRSSLALAARDILLKGGRRNVWLPAYCCESIARTFDREGFTLGYYPVDADLRGVDFDGRDGDTFLFIHYFGSRNLAAIGRIGSLRARGIRVVEDCVQAGLTRGVGTHGDYAVTSLRKLLAQPDGSLLASRLPVAFDGLGAGVDDEAIAARVSGKLLRGSRTADDTFLRLFDHAERRLDRGGPRPMSWISRGLLRATHLEAAATRRRGNWTCLRRGLSDSRLEGLTAVLEDIEEAEVPLGLPVRVPRGQRDALRRHLAGGSIYCAVHWPLDHLPPGGFAEERALSASILTLPLDQRYRADHMARLLDALHSFPGDLR